MDRYTVKVLKAGVWTVVAENVSYKDALVISGEMVMTHHAIQVESVENDGSCDICCDDCEDSEDVFQEVCDEYLWNEDLN